MILISHRGNLNGRNPERENSPKYVMEAVAAGFDVEVDVWVIESKYFLGHDNPQYEVDIDWLRSLPLWCHAKNQQALANLLEEKVHCFWHETDRFTLTSKGIAWCYPNNFQSKGITVSLNTPVDQSHSEILGVCTDYPYEWAAANKQETKQ